jgi:hypothetical protein
MTGVQLLAYVKRRLAESNLTVEADRDLELYDAISEGRDELLQALALAAPIVGKTTIVLEVDPADDRLYSFPAATADALRVIEFREATTREPFTPAAQLDQDNGDYEWVTPRQIRLSQGADPGDGIEATIIPHPAEITEDSTAAEIGLPTPCHRAIGKYAAVLALTADEESDAQVAMALYQRELEKLERLYGDYDMNGGLALREALMRTIGSLEGDSIY